MELEAIAKFKTSLTESHEGMAQLTYHYLL